MQNTEDDQTLEFLKVKLMERDRQISDFEATLKKIEFKHNRDLKEVKMNQDRAKTLLKEEKLRGDKLSKVAKQNQQQNNLLQKRVGELREQKERDVSEAKSQYNALKSEVRSYERILPTLTFLNQLNLSIQDIPPYEDVFLGMKQKVVQLDEAEAKFNHLKLKTEQEMATLQQNQQILRNKKIQIEKTLKEILPKLIDYEQKISDLSLSNQQLFSSNDELKEEIQFFKEKADTLEASLRQHQLKLQELDRDYAYELLQKEDQIKSLTQQEFDRYESEIASLENRLQIKDNMYQQQINILEEEIEFFQGRISEEKDHFQENYQAIKGDIDKMRQEIQCEREIHDQLKLKYHEGVMELNRIGKLKQQLEIKVQNQQKRIQSFRQQPKYEAKALSDVHLSQIANLQQNNEELLQKYEFANLTIKKLEEENAKLQQQMSMMHNQDISKNTPTTQFLDLPANILQFEVRSKRNSFNEELGNQNVYEINRERKKSEQLFNQKNELIEKDQNIQEQLGNLRKEKDQLMKDNLDLREKICVFTKTVCQKEQIIVEETRGQILFKTKANSLEKQALILSDESKKDKEGLKCLKQQLKQFKQLSNQQIEKSLREKKELTHQYEALRIEKQKIRTDSMTRQKVLGQEISLLKESLERDQNIKRQLDFETSQLQNINMEKESLLMKVYDYNKDILELKKQVDMLSQKLIKKQRQNEGLVNALARQRKQRCLMSVPSLTQVNDSKEDTVFNDIYNIVTQKENEINGLEREVSDLQQEIESLKMNYSIRSQAMEAQQNEYIQTIILMKVKCAQSEMRAAESQHLYSQLKKKIGKVSR